MSMAILPTYSQLDLGVDPPDYSPRARHGLPLQLTPTTVPSDNASDLEEFYVYSTKHLTLNLGLRLWRTALPAYGHGSTIQGFIDVNDKKGPLSVILTFEGWVTTSVREQGPCSFTVALPRLRLVSESTTLFDSSSALTPTRSTTSMRIPFAIPISLPKGYPPTSTFIQDGLVLETAYQLRIQLKRKGWSKKEELTTPIAYLPKTCPPPFNHRVAPLPESFNWKCRNKYESLEYKMFPLKRESKTPVLPLDDFSELDVQLFLPQPLAYAAQDVIPFRITLSTLASSFSIPFASSQSTNDTDENAALSLHVDDQKLIDNLSVELLKVVTVPAPDGRKVRREVLLARGGVCRVTKGVSCDGTRTQLAKVFGWIRGGKQGGEATWAVAEGPQVINEVRVTLLIPASSPNCSDVIYNHSVPIALRTNYMEDLLGNDLEAEEPALGLST